VGPGPGLTTDILRYRLKRLTAVEIHPDLASSLKRGWMAPTSMSSAPTQPLLTYPRTGSPGRCV
jgi:phospholipid N-methyltransferase